MPEGIGYGPTEDGEAKRVIARFNKAKAIWDLWKPQWQDAYDYTLPGRTRFDGHTSGQSNVTRLFDMTAPNSLQEFASRLQAGLVPQFAEWIELKSGSDVEESQRIDLDRGLREVTDFMFEAIHASNFDSQAHESLQDVGIGTGCLIIEDGDDQPIVVTAVPLTQFVLELGPFGTVDATYRFRMVKNKLLQRTWSDATFDVDTLARIEHDPDGETKVIEATWRDRDVRMDEVHHNAVVLVETEQVIRSGAFSGEGSNPWIPFRWSVAAGEVYGRGPVLTALPDIRVANLVVQMVLENAEVAIAGMWQYDDDGVLNPDTVELLAGTLIPRAPTGRGLEPLQTGSRFDVSQLVLSETRESIRRCLFDEDLGPPTGTPMSATEAQARLAMINRRIGSPVGRLQHEFLQPVVKRVLHILQKRGDIQIPRVNGKEVQIVPVSPLARARQQEGVVQFDRFMELLTTRFGPQVANVLIDQNKAANEIARRMGVDERLIRSPAEVQELAQQIQALSQAAPALAGGPGGEPGAAPPPQAVPAA